MDKSLLPYREGFERNIQLENAELLGIHPCGDSENGLELYKLLTREGFMITYALEDGILHYMHSNRIWKVFWNI
jgi:hypothetical protein